MSSSPRPIAVVLGMHRSGTSAVSGALVSAGFEAGRALLPSTSDNANGYFEDARLVQASDALLHAAGLAWDEFGPIVRPILGDAASKARTALRDVFDEIATKPGMFVVKDPRACRLVPEWDEAMHGAGLLPFYILVIRHPAEVAASLRARDGLSSYRAEQLWLAHLLESERATRFKPRVFLHFSDLIERPSATMSGVFASAPDSVRAMIPKIEEASSSGVDPALRRQRASVSDGPMGSIGDAYRLALSACAPGGDAPTMHAAFDVLWEQWETLQTTTRLALQDSRTRDLAAAESAARLEASARLIDGLVSGWRNVAAAHATLRPRVYWRVDDQEFSEDRSRHAMPIEERADGFVVEFPADTRCTRIRIDPHDEAGAFELCELSLDGVALEAVSDQVRVSNSVHFMTSVSGALVLGGDDDPWIELDLDGGSGERVMHELRLRVRRRGLPELLWSVLEDEAASRKRDAQLQRSLIALQADTAIANAAMRADAETARAALRAEAEAEGAALRAEIAQLRAQSESVLGRLDVLSQESSEVVGWMRRRTLGYWWRKWRHGGKKDGA